MDSMERLLKETKAERDFWQERAMEGGTMHFGNQEKLCGASSTQLALFASGSIKTPGKHEYPYDEDDWGRCERTIARIPSVAWLNRLVRLAGYPGWKDWSDRLDKAIDQRRQGLKHKEEVEQAIADAIQSRPKGLGEDNANSK